jgi:WD40 repeat protein
MTDKNWSIKFSPRGDVMAIGHLNPSLWNTKDRVKMGTVQGYSTFFHPDGRTFMTVDDGQLKLWDTQSAPLTSSSFAVPDGTIYGAAMSGDGNLIATVSIESDAKAVVRLWHATAQIA